MLSNNQVTNDHMFLTSFPTDNSDLLLGPVYTERQHQRCDDVSNTALMKTIESLQNKVGTQFIVTIDAQCGRALTFAV